MTTMPKTRGRTVTVDAHEVGSAASVRSRTRSSLRSLAARRLTWAEARRLTVTLILGCLAMALTIWIVPGVSAGVAVDVVAATLLLAVLSALLRPVLTSFALLLGWVGVLLAGLC